MSISFKLEAPCDNDDDMLSACDARQFVPAGRLYMSHHPGASQGRHRDGTDVDANQPLVKALRNISLTDDAHREWWTLRRSVDVGEGCEDELYVSRHTVVWMRGATPATRNVIKSFTMDSPIQQAMWCTFLLPVDEGKVGGGSSSENRVVTAQVESGVCITEANSVSIFTVDGKDYVTSLPFTVSRTWPMQNGLLFERTITSQPVDLSKTPNKKDQRHLPVLFSMLHPLDEVSSVICRTGGNSSTSKVSFVTETSQQIVFSCENPSLLVTFDRILSAHSVWAVRASRPEEVYTVCANASTSLIPVPPDTPLGSSYSTSALSKLTLSSQSHSMSPLLGLSSRLNSPSQSRLNSPSFTRIPPLSRCESPLMTSLPRLQTPSPRPRLRSSPATFARSPISLSHADASFAPEPAIESLIPEVCIDHLWTEAASIPRDGPAGRASKVFLSRDLCGQQYLCYLVTYRHHLRCVKFGESNDKSQLIFGSLCILQARDAVALPAIDMIAVLDLSYQLILYTGTTKMSQIHVGGLPSSAGLSFTAMQLRPTFDTPLRPVDGLVTSSRPSSAMDARFDDEVQLLSPVPTEFNDSSQIIDTSLADDISFPVNDCLSSIAGLRDPIDHKFTVEMRDGSMYRTALPKLSGQAMIKLCMEALKQSLPKDVALQVMIRWYLSHNAPGSVNGQSDWIQFVSCLLGMMGYDVLRLGLHGQTDIDMSPAPTWAPKKAKPSDQGSNDDWETLLSSDHHQRINRALGHVLGLSQSTATVVYSQEGSTVDSSAPLFVHVPRILFVFHLVYEELKLNKSHVEELYELALFLWQLSSDLRFNQYTDHYCRDFVQLFRKPTAASQMNPEHLGKMNWPTFVNPSPPHIYQWLCSLLNGLDSAPFPYLPGVSNTTKNVVAMYVVLVDAEDPKEITWSKYLRKVSAAGHRCDDFEESLMKSFRANTVSSCSQYERLVLFVAELGTSLVNCSGYGICLPLKEAIFYCRANPPSNWPEKAYLLIGREDLARQITPERPESQKACGREGDRSSRTAREEDDGMDYLDSDLLKLRFSEDLRVDEARRLLQSSKSVRIALTQRPEVSDHEFIQEQERHLYATCIRTMAIPLGRGMFTLCTYQPVPTETLPIPKLCLTGRVPPRNTTVDLTHIDTPVSMSHWPQFHNGVAAGLRIANSSQVDSPWILYNRPRSNELTIEHAGFLMGLGLNGHLPRLATLNVHNYLCRGHEMTSVALLLGIAAGKRGTMDVATTRLLSIHVAALLPPTSTELDVPHNVQVTAVLGVGLVYQATAHRHIAEVLLNEIGRPPGPEMDNCTDRESYSLAAGLALGLVMLGKGCEHVGMADLSMADQLYYYMVGGHKRPLTGMNKERYKSPSYQIKEGDCVNINVTSPGATLALGMMFFRTNNSAVAEWLLAPDTQFLLDFVRPDFLMLQLISRCLVLWDSIHPSEEWITSNLPEIVTKYAFQKSKYSSDAYCDIDFETMSQAYCNLIAGASMALALKFAGSSNEVAFNALYKMTKKMLALQAQPSLVEQAGKSTVEQSVIIMTVSLAMVMAGSGNLQVLRLCRHLRSRVGAAHTAVLYGSHMAVSMAVGLLFLGGGRYTLSTKPESIAILLCTFFPKWPIHSNDNRYHLQAFRHLYVLATEPRLLLPRDVTSSQACYVPVDITFKDCDAYKGQVYRDMAPCILPELHLLSEVTAVATRYWPVGFKDDKNWDVLSQMLDVSGYLNVKQRAGHLPYSDDPKGYHSVLAKSVTSDTSLGKVIKPEDVKSFCSDARIVAFAEYFCSAYHEQEYDKTQFLSHILYECVSQEKLDMLEVYVAMHQAVEQLASRSHTLDLCQLKLVFAFYQRVGSEAAARLINDEFLPSLQSTIENTLEQWQHSCSAVLSRYMTGDIGVVTEGNSALLSAFLTWYDIPHASTLAHFDTQGVSTFAELYKHLHPTGMTVAAIMALSQPSPTPNHRPATARLR